MLLFAIGEMAYMGRSADARRHPAAVLPEVRSVVMVAMEYGASGGRQPPGPACGDRDTDPACRPLHRPPLLL